MDQQKQARPVQRRAQGVQRIASILDAAETVFAHTGYDEATTNHIAAQAGISPGSLYQFFANKEECPDLQSRPPIAPPGRGG